MTDTPANLIRFLERKIEEELNRATTAIYENTGLSVVSIDIEFIDVRCVGESHQKKISKVYFQLEASR